VAGDTCDGGDSLLYEPLTLSCPQAVSITSNAHLQGTADHGSLVTLVHTTVTFTVTSPTPADSSSDPVIFRLLIFTS
jgi:hypothetical protein